MDKQLFFAFLLTLLAGISTGIGSAIAFFAKRTHTSFLSVSLGFSAGVMIYVSFMDLMPNAVTWLSEIHGTQKGTLYATLSFFAGVLLILLIDRLVPDRENPHEMRRVEAMEHIGRIGKDTRRRPNLLRTGLITALVLGLHNFPGLKDINIAIPISIAIAIHNIPEGISVSVPIYYATGNRKYAFCLSFLSGLAEPVGAFIGYLLLAPYLNDQIFGLIFGVIAGIMVFISLDELLPAAEEYGKHHHAVYGLIAGMTVMAASLILLA